MLVLEVRPHASSQRRAYPVISVRLWISRLVSEDDTVSNDNYSQCHRSSTDSAAGMGVIMDVITCTNLIRLQYLNGHWASVRRHLFLGGFLHSVAVTMSRFLVPICSSSCKCLCRMGLGFHSDCLRFCYLPGWLCCVVLCCVVGLGLFCHHWHLTDSPMKRIMCVRQRYLLCFLFSTVHQQFIKLIDRKCIEHTTRSF